jgi:ketosteroid isomerase-like protein
MRGRTLILVAAACAAFAAGCAKPAPQAPAVDLAAEAQAVRDRSAAWLQLAQAKDVAGIVNGVLTADSVALFDGNIRKGTAELQAGMEAENANMPNSTISWTTSDVHVAASGDLAYELGSFTFDADGDGEAAAANGEFVTVWTKADGTWRAAVDSGTVRKAAEAAAPAGG